jgi:hypothetical protein
MCLFMHFKIRLKITNLIKQYSSHVAAVGGCATIVAAANKFAEPLVPGVALQLLKILARNNTNSIPLHDAGVCELVIKNLSSDVEFLRQQAVSCFTSLCSFGDLNTIRLFALGGIDLVIHQMGKHISDLYYSYTCCLALECMLSYNDILQRMISLNVKKLLSRIKKVSFSFFNLPVFPQFIIPFYINRIPPKEKTFIKK